MPSSHEHGWQVPATPREASGLRQEIVEFARDGGVPEARLGELGIAVSEAVANAVIHAFVHTEPGTITATTSLHPEIPSVRVVICDDGSGMAPRDDSPGLGLGLTLIGRLSSEHEIGLPPDGVGTRVSMQFDFALDGAGRDEPALALT